MLQEGRGGRRDLREHPREDTRMHKPVTEGEARGLAQEGNQEAPAVARPDQDMGHHERHQGQEASTRPAEAD